MHNEKVTRLEDIAAASLAAMIVSLLANVASFLWLGLPYSAKVSDYAFDPFQFQDTMTVFDDVFTTAAAIFVLAAIGMGIRDLRAKLLK